MSFYKVSDHLKNCGEFSHYNKFSLLFGLCDETPAAAVDAVSKKLARKLAKKAKSDIILAEFKNLCVDIFSAERAPIIYPSETGVDLQEFHLFNKLPVELRVSIWALTYRCSRVVPLMARYNLHHTLHLYSSFGALPMPVTLHVNCESRSEAQKVYELCFENSTTRKDFVNFAGDVFFIMGEYGLIDVPIISSDPDADEAAQTAAPTNFTHCFVKTACGEDFDKIQRLIVSMPCFRRQFASDGKDPMRFFGLPAHLKELLVVSSIRGGHMVNYNGPGFEFVEDQDKGYVEGEDDDKNHLGHGKAWWRAQKEAITQTFEAARRENPDWKAPFLKFGKAVALEAVE